MDLKERLNRLTSISKPQPEGPSQTLNDFRQRIDRLLEPKKVYRKKEIIPVEQLVKGEVISTPYGEAFRVKDYFPPDFRYGEMTLTEILNIPTYPAHLLTKDERLKELDFQKALFLDTETTGLSEARDFCLHGGIGFLPGRWVFDPSILYERLFRRESFSLAHQRAAGILSIPGHF
jgi:hypothetical protein